MKTKIKHKEYTSSEITQYAIKVLSAHGHKVWRNNNLAVKGRKFIGMKGASDILGITNRGKFLACEVKKKGDVFSKEQLDFLNGVWVMGGMALTAVQEEGKIIIKDFFQKAGQPPSYEKSKYETK